MAVSGITSGSTSGASATSSTDPFNQLGRDDFLRLLITQVQNQNPLEPMQDTQFVSQLAQFSQLDGMLQLNSSFSSLLLMQGLTQGSNLIGKTITYQSTGTNPQTQRGQVSSVQVQDGKIKLMIGTTAVDLSQVRTVETAAA